MPKIAYTVAYDGRPFEGWQSQPSGITVQDRLEHAFTQLLGRPIRIHGSGRTDAGVHATGQVFHAEWDNLPSIPLEKWPVALNTKLPFGIRVLEARAVDDSFHARFSSCGKQYRYVISTRPILNPFDHGLVWHVPFPMDDRLISRSLDILKGEHDFRAFASLRGNEPDPIPDDYFIRTLFDAAMARNGDSVTLTFHGSGFMYKMVRLMVGGIHAVASGKLDIESFKRLVNTPSQAKSPYCAPPNGLYLDKVYYE